MKNLKNTWNAWWPYLLILVILSIGPAQCTYDNYVKWQVAKAAKEIEK
ncbi:hypothetical protein [Acinetobacter bohemicus]